MPVTRELAGAQPAQLVVEVDLWFAPLDVPSRTTRRLATMLSPDERERAALRIGLPAQRRFTVAHAFLRMVLATYLHTAPEWLRFDTDPHGKPVLAGPVPGRRPRFSLAHACNTALLAVSWDREVGVDAERIRLDIDIDALAGWVFSPAERRILALLDPVRQRSRWFQGWTAKEAYLKARGVGLTMPLDEIEVLGSDGVLVPSVDPADGTGPWRLIEVAAPVGMVATLVAEGDDVMVTPKWWRW